MELPIAGDAPAVVSSDGDAHVPDTPEELDALVKGNDIVLFMKGTPQQPMCGFSARAAQVLEATGHAYENVNVFAHPDPMAYIQTLGTWAQFPTLPQVWVKGELIGGSDIAADMLESGELGEMLAEGSE